MKLFKLVSTTRGSSGRSSPYQPKIMFVLADNEQEAREQAVDYDKQSSRPTFKSQIWLDSKIVLCQEIDLNEKEVIYAI